MYILIYVYIIYVYIYIYIYTYIKAVCHVQKFQNIFKKFIEK